MPASAIFQLEIDHLKKWAHELYQLYLQVWEIQGKEKTSELVRAIFRNEIVPLIQRKKEDISCELRLRFKRTGSSDGILNAYLQELERIAPRVESDWRRRTEVEARELEYRGRKHPNGDSPWGEIDHELVSLKLSEVAARLNNEFESGLQKIRSQQMSALKTDAPPINSGQQIEVELEFVPSSEPASQQATPATNKTLAQPEESKTKAARRGPLADMDYHCAVAAIVKPFGNKWREQSNLDKIAVALDQDKDRTPPSKKWAALKPAARSWKRAVELHQERVYKSIAHSLYMVSRDDSE